MEKNKNITVVEPEAQSPEEAAKVIAQAFEEKRARKRKLKNLVNEMTLLTVEFHHGIIDVAKRFDMPAKDLMFDAVKTLIDMLSEWDESCEEITGEDLTYLEGLRQQVLAARNEEESRTPARGVPEVGETPYGG